MASNEQLLSKIVQTVDKFSSLEDRLKLQLAMAEGFLRTGNTANARFEVEASIQKIAAARERDLYAYFDIAVRLAACLHKLNDPQRGNALLDKLQTQSFDYDDIDIRDWIFCEIAIAHGSLGNLEKALQVSYDIEDDFERTGGLYEELVSQVIAQDRPQLLSPIFNAITTNQEKRYLMEHAAIQCVLSDKPMARLSFFIELNDTFEAIKAEISIAKKCNYIKAHSTSSYFLDQAQKITILLVSSEVKVEQLCEIACLRVELGQVEMAQALLARIGDVICNFSTNGDPDRAIAKEIMQSQQTVVAFQIHQHSELRPAADVTSNNSKPDRFQIPSILEDSDTWEQMMHQLSQPERNNQLEKALQQLNEQLPTTEERLHSCHLERLIEVHFAAPKSRQ